MILITGGTGFIGLHLAYHLANRGEKTLLLGRRAVEPPSFLTSFWDNAVKAVSGDILDLPNLLKLIKEHSVESIIHAANVKSDSLYQILRSNLEGTANVLEAARIFDLRRLTFISSVTVYRGSKAELLGEDIELPVLSSRYPGLTRYVPAVKKAGEEICFLYAKDYGLSVAMVRVARVYGPLGHETSPIAIMVRSAVAHKPADLTHVGGEDKVNYVYAPDATKGIALVHLAEAPKHNIYNVGGTEHDLSEFAQVVKEVIPDAEIRLGMVKPERTTVRAPLDITRIKEETGYIPNYDLKRGIRSYINWVRDGKFETKI